MTIGERVLQLVHDRGMTQKEFSEKTGIPQSTMSSWKGKKQNPSIDKLKVICDTLEVDPYYLVSGSETNESLNDDYLTVYRKDEEYEKNFYPWNSTMRRKHINDYYIMSFFNSILRY